MHGGGIGMHGGGMQTGAGAMMAGANAAMMGGMMGGMMSMVPNVPILWQATCGGGSYFGSYSLMLNGKISQQEFNDCVEQFNQIGQRIIGPVAKVTMFPFCCLMVGFILAVMAPYWILSAVQPIDDEDGFGFPFPITLGFILIFGGILGLAFMACKSADVSQRCMVELTAKFSELNQVYNPRGLNFSLNSGGVTTMMGPYGRGQQLGAPPIFLEVPPIVPGSSSGPGRHVYNTVPTAMAPTGYAKPQQPPARKMMNPVYGAKAY